MPKPQRVIILAEQTPNPDTLRFDPGRSLVPSPGAEFSREVDARAGSPLAAALFALSGVARVLIAPGFVAVTRTCDTDWPTLAARVRDAMRDHLEAGLPILSEGYVADEVVPDSDEAREVQRILEHEIRPGLARDGGDARFVGYAEGVLRLGLRGSCADCPRSTATLRETIEGRLRQSIPGFKRVEAD